MSSGEHQAPNPPPGPLSQGRSGLLSSRGSADRTSACRPSRTESGRPSPVLGVAGGGELKRVLGPTTALLVGLGVAIGSGIFRTPGLVAGVIPSPLAIIGLWITGGLFILAASLVTAELATRFPSAGGEYVYLREAYGELLAFFFGWGYTVFIIGGGAATIAAACGEAAAELIGAPPDRAPLLGAGALIGVTVINALGVRAGASFQNALSALKLLAVTLVALLAFTVGEAETDWTAPPSALGDRSLLAAMIAALPPVLWAYEGTTDAVKLAEEIRDVKRELPRALIRAALALTILYVGVNVAYLAALTPEEIASSRFVVNDIVERYVGAGGRRAITGISLIVFLGALSSTILATVRVTFALARDGLAFRALGRMSEAQAPVGALAATGAIALLLTLYRGFDEILNIYFLASAVLFGLAYASLIVFRIRDAKSGGFPEGVFRCPFGPALALILISVQLGMALYIVIEHPTDSIWTLVLLASLFLLYVVWKKTNHSPPASGRG